MNNEKAAALAAVAEKTAAMMQSIAHLAGIGYRFEPSENGWEFKIFPPRYNHPVGYVAHADNEGEIRVKYIFRRDFHPFFYRTMKLEDFARDLTNVYG